MGNLSWLGDRERSALIDKTTGAVKATLQHDGYGRFDACFYGSLWSSLFWKQLSRHDAIKWRLSRPLCLRFWSCNIKTAGDVNWAMEKVEEALQLDSANIWRR